MKPLHILTIASASLLAMSCQQSADVSQTDEAPIMFSTPVEEALDTKEEADKIDVQFADWYKPSEPFRIIGNIYSVGSKGLSVYFIPTDKGHILIDGGLPENAKIIAENIETLGYKLSDVSILLNTHAHFDHSGGLAELKKLSGAQMIAHDGDKSALEGGFYLGSEDVEDLKTKPVKVDRSVADGEVISLGDTNLTAHLTPGHSRGCTSWKLKVKEEGMSYEALIFCSASVALNRLVGKPAVDGEDATRPQYEGIVQDYQKTFEVTRDWKPDVFLSNHPEFFKMAEKRAKQKAGNGLAFVNPDEFSKFIEKMESDFEKNLAKQKAAVEQ